MSASAIEKLVWSLIYGGLLVGSLGIFLLRDSDAFGWTLLTLAGLAVTAGVLLIWARSRMKTTPQFKGDRP